MTKEEAGLGVFSGLVASMCCIGPTVIVLLGLGPLFGITSLCFAQHRWIFASLGLAALGSGIYLWLRKKEGTCDIDTVKKNRKRIFVAIGIMLVTYALLMTFVLPELHSQVMESASCTIGL